MLVSCMLEIIYIFLRVKHPTTMSDINTIELAKQVRARRGNISLREAAKKIGGISIATLSRIEQGRDANTSNYLKICDWLEVPSETFRTNSSEVTPIVDHKKEILYHLRADRDLSKDVSDALQKMIELAYVHPQQ